MQSTAVVEAINRCEKKMKIRFFHRPLLFSFTAVGVGLLLLVVLLLLIALPLQQPLGVHSDTLADGTWLASLYTATNGAGWKFACRSGWDPSNPSSVCDGWSGVGCNGTSLIGGVVTSVTLNECNLQGGPLPEIPPALPGRIGTAMQHCQNLTLFVNALTGPLPSSWSSMSSLASLAMYYTTLSGTLPDSWGSMASIQQLVLSVSKLSGTLPSSWANMTSLRLLAISASSLSGSLPPSWSSLSSLTYLDLDANSFTGTLPDSWFSLSLLDSVLLYQNTLSGTLPETWSKLSSLRRLQIFQNNLTGKLPSSWSKLSSLRTLQLFQNSLRGTLPASWSMLQPVSYDSLNFDFRSNYFIGDIPSRWLWSNATIGGFLGENCLNVSNMTAVTERGRFDVGTSRSASTCAPWLLRTPTTSHASSKSATEAPQSSSTESLQYVFVSRSKMRTVTISESVTSSSASSSLVWWWSGSSSLTASQHIPLGAQSVEVKSFPIAAQSVAMFASMFAAPAAAFTVQRAGLSLRLLVCDVSLDDAPDIPTSPTEMSIGSDVQRYQRGTVIGNLCLLVGIVMGCVSLCAWYSQWRGSTSLWRCAASLRLPGWLVTVWSFLLQPNVSAVGCLLMQPEGQRGQDVAIGLVMVAVCLLVLGAETHLLVFSFRATRTQSGAEPSMIEAKMPNLRSVLRQFVTYVTGGEEKEGETNVWRDLGENIDAQSTSSSSSSHHFVKHYGAIFEAYRQGAHPFHLVDTLLAIVCGMLQAIATVFSSSGCSAVLYTLCVLQILYAIVIVLWRPHEGRSEWIVACVMSSLGAVFGVLVLIPNCDQCDSVAAMFAQGQVYMAFADLCVSVINVIRSGRVKRMLSSLLLLCRPQIIGLPTSMLQQDSDYSATQKKKNQKEAEEAAVLASSSLPSHHPPPHHHEREMRMTTMMASDHPEFRQRLMVLSELIDTICAVKKG